MPAIVVIPARLGSTRFPRKMLAAETGRPLVQHVVDRVKMCKRVGEVIVATDSEEIVTALRPFGTQCILTAADHPSGTDRIAEVMRGRTEEIVVNVQGDEPEIEPEIIDGLIERLESHDEQMATAATLFREGMDSANPNLVKVVMDENGRPLFNMSATTNPVMRWPVRWVACAAACRCCRDSAADCTVS